MFWDLNKCPRSINYEEKTAPTPQKYYISATHEYRDMTIYILLHVNGFYIIHKDYTESNYIIIAKKFVHILSYKLIWHYPWHSTLAFMTFIKYSYGFNTSDTLFMFQTHYFSFSKYKCTRLLMISYHKSSFYWHIN